MVFTVFISHSTEDMDIVHKLAQYLKLNGINVHVSEWYEQPGELLPQKVARLLKASDCMLALLTVGGERSRWVNQEIGFAKGTPILILPIVEQGVKVTGFLEGLEYIPFNRDNPYDAVTRATEYLNRLAIRKEQERRKALGSLLFLLGLFALAERRG